MIINKILLSGIKNIENINLELSKIIALVGINNYGKSNILSSIDFAFNFIQTNEKQRDYFMSDQSEVPINNNTSDKDFIFLFEFLYNINDTEYIIEYSYGFIWAKTDKEGNLYPESNKINYEKLRMKINSPRQQFATYINRNLNSCKYKKILDTKNGRCDQKLDINKMQLAIDKMSLLDGIEYKEIFNSIQNIKFSLNNYIDTKSIDVTLPFYFKGQQDFSLNSTSGRNVYEIVYRLYKQYPEKFTLLVDTFKQLFPNIESIVPLEKDFKESGKFNSSLTDDTPFLISEKIYSIAIKDKNNNQYTTFQSLSNGSRRIFLFIVSAILSEINNISIIAFEELENCIHPALFQKLIIILDSLILNCRIIVTSHSPFLIDYFDLNRVYIGMPNDLGLARFKRIRNKNIRTIHNNAREEEITIGNYIFDALLNPDADNIEAYCE